MRKVKANISNFQYKGPDYSSYLAAVERKEKTSALAISRYLMWASIVLGFIGFFVTYKTLPYFIDNYLPFIRSSIENYLSPSVAKYVISIMGGVYSFVLELVIGVAVYGLYNNWKKGNTKGSLFFIGVLAITMGITVWSNGYTVDNQISGEVNSKVSNLDKSITINPLLSSVESLKKSIETKRKEADMIMQEMQHYRVGSGARNRRKYQLEKINAEIARLEERLARISEKTSSKAEKEIKTIEKEAKEKAYSGFIIAAMVEGFRAFFILLSLISLSVAKREDLQYCVGGECDFRGEAQAFQEPKKATVLQMPTKPKKEAAITDNNPIGFIKEPEKAQGDSQKENKPIVGFTKENQFSFFNENDLRKGVALTFKNGSIKPGDDIPSNSAIAHAFGFAESGKKVQPHHISQLVKAELKRVGAIQDIPGKPQKAVITMEEALERLGL